MKDLTTRMIQFLKQKGEGEWVYDDVLKRKAKENGYSDTEIEYALEKLEESPEIGKKFNKYCWYDITQEQRERTLQGMDWFNEL